MFSFNVLYTNNTFDYNRMEFVRGKPIDKEYRVIYCDKVYMLESINKHTEDFERESIIGFDTETALTNYNIDHDKEKPTIIQYGTVDKVIVINVSSILKAITVQEFIGKLPSLLRILTSKSIIKVGVDLIHDISKMAALGMNVDMYCDLQWMAQLLGYDERGLNALSEKVIGSQKYDSTSHNWYSVTDNMIEYAARDVVLPLLVFDTLFGVLYEYMLAQLIPNIVVDVFYDLFDLSVIMVNHSKHNIKSNVSIRNFIIRSMNMFGIIVTTMVSEEYLALVDKLYTKISEIDTIVPPYTNEMEFKPIRRDDYYGKPNLTDDIRDKLDYYEREQRTRLITSEENTIINELLSKIATKNKVITISRQPIIQDQSKVDKLMKKYPSINANNANTLVNSYKDHIDSYNIYKKLPCNPSGEQKQTKILHEAKLKKTYKTITNILQQHNLTSNDVEYKLYNIEDNARKCITPVPYKDQLSLDDIIGMIPRVEYQTDIDSFVENVVNIQESLRYLNNLPEFPTKKDNVLINEYTNKYKSNMAKLKLRVKRFNLDKDIFLRLPEPFALE